jgi:crossover junction endodeoxyribonuclease RuvC
VCPTVLGIDPGLHRTGYAVVEYISKDPILREAGVLTTKESDTLQLRLKSIYDSVQEVIEEFHPDLIVVENLYSHFSHPQTAVVMGHARGIIFLCAAHHSLPVTCYAATRIKKSVTGNGRASKLQVQRSIQNIMKLEKLPDPPDVADAIAVALCHLEAAR